MTFESKSSNNHPVVALPTNCTMDDIRNSTAGPRSQTPGRSARLANLAPRPKSPSRTPASRSRDIVQEVYDRMGVNYVRGQSCFEFDDNKSTISIHSGTKSVTKSPSRNRANARYLYNPPTSPGRLSSRSLNGEDSRSRSEHVKEQQHPVVVRPHEDGSFPSLKKPNHTCTYPVVDKRDNEKEQETKHFVTKTNEERDDGEDDDGRQSPVSVKSRISAFSAFGGGKSVTSTRSSTGISSSSHSRINRKNDIMGTKHGSQIGNGGTRYLPKSSSQRSMNSGVASNFLAAIASHSSKSQHSPSLSAAVPRQNKTSRSVSTSGLIRPSDASAKSVPVEIHPTADPNDNDDDDLSAVSGDDFAASSSKKIQPASSKIIGGNNNGGIALTKEMVDKMLEEKLQAQLSRWNETTEKKLQQLELEMKFRLDEMERKLNALSTNEEGLKVNTSCTPATMNAEPRNSPVVKGGNYYRSYRR